MELVYFNGSVIFWDFKTQNKQRQTDKQRDRWPEKQTDRETVRKTDRQTKRHAERQRDPNTNIETDRQKDTQLFYWLSAFVRQIHYIKRQTERKREMQKDRQTGDRQINRQTKCSLLVLWPSAF